jgi:PKD repeat protein
MVSIRLIPPGVIAIGPTARFTFLPSNPPAFSPVRFDGSASTAGLGASITGYVWDFGDGTSGTGITATHQYTVEGIYLVKLTVTDSNGLAGQSPSQPLTVGAGSAPTADFVFSPSAPGVGDTVFFNGTVSTPGAGHRIVRYDWDFGSGSRRSGATVTKVYDEPSTYAVVLTVTDEAGQTAQAIKPVTVGAPAPTVARFTFSPTDPGPGDSVNFNASTSTTAAGNTITSYEWDFGDGSSTTTTIATTAHTYAAVGSYVVTLRIIDSSGGSDLETQTVAVQ